MEKIVCYISILLKIILWKLQNFTKGNEAYLNDYDQVSNYMLL